MKQVRLGIDMRMMKPFPTGIGTHFLNLTKHLVQAYPKYRVTLIINKRGEEIVKKTFADLPVEYVMIDVHGGSFKQYLLFPFLWVKYKKLPIDILLTDPWCVFPFLPKPYLMMVYDLIGFHHVAKMTIKQILFDRFLYTWMARRAKGIIATLLSGKKDVVELLHVPASRVYVVEASVSDEYKPTIVGNDAILHKYGLDGKKYMVYLGNRRPHKNLLGALEVCSILSRTYNQKDLYFYLIGSFDTEKSAPDDLHEALHTNYKDIQDHVVFLGRIASNTDVAAIMKGAVALLHPSKFEGFGLTPLEAMSVGTPVVSSSIASIADVVQDAGILHNPEDYEGHAEAINALITNPSLRQEYIKKGLARAKVFTWEKSAEKLSMAIDTCVKK